MTDRRTIKSLEDFKDMDDVRKTVDKIIVFNNWDKDSEEAYSLKKLFGVLPSEGISEEITNIGSVDRGIATIIKLMNDIGLKTLASCSGLDVDHPNARDSHNAYISILKDDDEKVAIHQINVLQRILEGIDDAKIELSGTCYLKPAISFRFEDLNDENLKQRYIQILKNIHKLQDKTYI